MVRAPQKRTQHLHARGRVSRCATPARLLRGVCVPRIARFAAFVLAALLFFGLPSIIGLYTDWLWFGETGYRQVFTTTLGTRLLLGTLTFLLTFAWLLLNLRVALA